MARDLIKAGWTNARAIVGGWDAWLAADLPTRSKSDPAGPLERI